MIACRKRVKDYIVFLVLAAPLDLSIWDSLHFYSLIVKLGFALKKIISMTWRFTSCHSIFDFQNSFRTSHVIVLYSLITLFS